MVMVDRVPGSSLALANPGDVMNTLNRLIRPFYEQVQLTITGFAVCIHLVVPASTRLSGALRPNVSGSYLLQRRIILCIVAKFSNHFDTLCVSQQGSNVLPVQSATSRGCEVNHSLQSDAMAASRWRREAIAISKAS